MSIKQPWTYHNKRPKTPTTPRTPKSPASPTIGDLFQAERPSKYLSGNQFSPRLEKKAPQHEERLGFQTIKKISVLAKVKEKARKWRQTLGRKKQGQNGDPVPSWGAFEDYENDEYHRRPSKLFTLRRSAHSYKEGRSTSSLSINEKRVLSYSADRGYTEHCEKIKETASPKDKLPNLGEDIKILAPEEMSQAQVEPPSYEEVVQEFKVEDITHLKETEEEEEEEEEKKTDDFESEETDEEVKIMPLDSQEEDKDEELKTRQLNSQEEDKDEEIITMSTISQEEDKDEEVITIPMISRNTRDEDKRLNQICMKLIQAERGKTPTPSPEDGANEEEKQQEGESSTQIKSLAESVTEKLASSDSEGTQMINSEEEKVMSLPAISTKKESKHNQEYEENGTSGERKWDTGASVKEYIKNKLEPGEDERALSQVISEAISPRRTPGDKGVIEKVKEAVTLLLLAEQKQMERELEHKQKRQQQEEQEREQRSRSSSSVQIPVSTYAYEEDDLVEEESHGRILQAN